MTHAVVLAPWWRATASFWLPPEGLFARIPYAYLAFALYAASLAWLIARLVGPRPDRRAALRLGIVAGVVAGVLTGLTAYSVFPMPHSALLVWPLSMTLASGAAALAAQWTLSSHRPWKGVARAAFLSLVLFVAGVIVQSIFFPPAPP